MPAGQCGLVELGRHRHPGRLPRRLVRLKGVDGDSTPSGLVQGFGIERDLAVGVKRVRVRRAHSPWSDHARSASKARSASRVSAS